MKIEAGLIGPMLTDSGSSAPISTPETTTTTSRPSSTGTSEPTRKESDSFREAAASQITITIVWIAMPPIRFPAARPRFPWAAAETVIATSGRLPAIASRIIPPSASPRPKRRSITSVVRESAIPAPQVATAAPAKSSTSTTVESEPISVSGGNLPLTSCARGSAAGRRRGADPTAAA